MAQLPTGGTLTSTAKTSIPAPTRARQQAIDATVEYLTYLFTLPQTRLAWMGDGMGGLIVSDRQRFFYVRVGGATGEVAEAKCIIPLLEPRIDDKVLIRRERPGGLGPWDIIEYYGTLAPAILFCEIITAGVWFLYTNSVRFQLLTDVTPTAAETDVPNWYSLFGLSDVAQFISPSTELEVVVVGQVGATLSLYHSPDRGTNWLEITNYVNDINPDKARFDDSDRDRGWVVTFEDLDSAARADLNGSYPVPAVGYTPFVALDYFLTRDYQPLTIHMTVDGGETWTDFVLEYFGDTYGYWVAPSVSASFSGDPGGYCTFFPGTSAVHSSEIPCDEPDGGVIQGFIVCEGFVFGDPTIFLTECAHAWVAPLHDDANVYVTAALTLFNTVTFENECYTVSDRSHYTNQLYKVAADGTISDSFQFQTEVFESKDFFTSIETDRADDTIMYGLCSRNYDFNPSGSNLQSGRLFRIDWGGHTGVDISPHNPAGDVLFRVLSASTGTLFAPVTQTILGIKHLIMWRSLDFGGTWADTDLTDTLGVTYSIYPIVAEAVYGSFVGALVIMTRDGKVSYSFDDGVTWAATGVILETELNEVGTFNQDLGA